MLKAVQELGLVQPHANDAAAQMGMLGVQPTLPWFLARRLDHAERSEQRTAIREAFRDYARKIGASLLQLIQSREPDQRRQGLFLAGIEFDTLSAALEDALGCKEAVYTLFEPLRQSLESTRQFGPIARLANRVIAGLNTYPDDTIDEKTAVDRITITGNAATALLELRQFDDAQTGYQSVLAAIDKLTDPHGDQAQKWRVVSHHQLGRVAQERRDFDAAEAAYKTALEICIRLDDEYEAADTYHQLGIVAQERQDFDAAEAAYKTALELYIRLDDEYEAAGTYHQLGRVAEERRDFDAAEAAYKTALEIYIRLDDEHSAVVVIGGIARLAAADPDRRDRLTSLVAKRTEMAAEDVAELFAKAQPNDED